MVDPDALMVLSFLALYAAGFLALLRVIETTFTWLWDNDCFWFVAVPLATVMFLHNIS